VSAVEEKTIYLLGKKFPSRLHGLATPLTGSKQIQEAVQAAAAATDWVALDQQSAGALLKQSFMHLMARPDHQLGNLLLQDPPSLASIALAQRAFSAVAWTDRRQGWLPVAELLEVLHSPDRANLLIGGMVDPDTQTLTVYRGDARQVVVPLSIFKRTADGEVPVFGDFRVIDHGHAVRFGRYESAADVILYEGDPVYRRRVNARRRAEERTYGASLRRLRRQRRLRQSDFPGVAARTILRIENGEIHNPHAETVELIAKRLGVRPDAIGTY